MRFYSHIVLALMIMGLAACQQVSSGPLETQVAATMTPLPTQALPTATSTAIPPTAIPTPTNTPAKNYKDLKVGFTGGGCSGHWGQAEVSSLSTTAAKLGVGLRLYNSSCNADTQLLQIRTLINSKVDVIGIEQVWGSTSEKWADVLTKAHDANIPVILVNGNPNNISDSQYTSLLDYDFVEEGRMAGAALGKLLNGKGNIVVVAAQAGWKSSDDRTQGFLNGLKDFPDIKIIDTKNGDYTRGSGYSIMADFMKSEGDQINGAYFANDDMGFGGIQAIKAAGKKPGKDIKIVSIDGWRTAFMAMIKGDLNATVECNPIIGPQFFELVFKAANGQLIPNLLFVKDNIFFAEQAKETLPTRMY
jgi:ABC-type sugar transport system substrate-binding protein